MELAFFSALKTAEKAIESEQRWEQLEKRKGIAIQHDSNHIVGWREFAELEDIYLLITPNPRKEGSYSITTRDTEILKIPENSTQTFLHANQFIASYPSFDDAIDHAESCLLYTSPSPRDATLSRMPSSA